MATKNTFTSMFNKMSKIFRDDKRTSQWAVYGAEYAKKKTTPCIVIFPAQKSKLTAPETRQFRGTSLPQQFAYQFNIWCYVTLTEQEDAYYSVGTGANSGLTQVMTEVEAVLKDNKEGTDLVDSSQLWYDIEFEDVSYAQKFGKLMFGTISVKLIRTELE